MKITTKEIPLFEEPIMVVTHKTCEAHLAIFGNELNIQFIRSKREGKGHATEMIKELLKHCEKNNLILASSIPLSSGWEYLIKKFGIKTYK